MSERNESQVPQLVELLRCYRMVKGVEILDLFIDISDIAHEVGPLPWSEWKEGAVIYAAPSKDNLIRYEGDVQNFGDDCEEVSIDFLRALIERRIEENKLVVIVPFYREGSGEFAVRQIYFKVYATLV